MISNEEQKKHQENHVSWLDFLGLGFSHNIVHQIISTLLLLLN